MKGQLAAHHGDNAVQALERLTDADVIAWFPEQGLDCPQGAKAATVEVEEGTVEGEALVLTILVEVEGPLRQRANDTETFRAIGNLQVVDRAGEPLGHALARIVDLVTEASRRFGSQAVVVSIDVARDPADGRRQVFTEGGTKATGLEPADWAKEVERLGAGEILLNSIDRDGAGTGEPALPPAACSSSSS
jgi:imidazole glycerol phosphate synthase subunit HisF